MKKKIEKNHTSHLYNWTSLNSNKKRINTKFSNFVEIVDSYENAAHGKYIQSNKFYFIEKMENGRNLWCKSFENYE